MIDYARLWKGIVHIFWIFVTGMVLVFNLAAFAMALTWAIGKLGLQVWPWK